MHASDQVDLKVSGKLHSIMTRCEGLYYCASNEEWQAERNSNHWPESLFYFLCACKKQLFKLSLWHISGRKEQAFPLFRQKRNKSPFAICLEVPSMGLLRKEKEVANNFSTKKRFLVMTLAEVSLGTLCIIWYRKAADLFVSYTSLQAMKMNFKGGGKA